MLRVWDPEQVDHLLHPNIEPAAAKAAKPIGKGLAASPGAGVGQVVFRCGVGEGVGCEGQEGDHGAPGDVAGGPCGHERCAGYPDCPRWHDGRTLRWLLAVWASAACLVAVTW